MSTTLPSWAHAVVPWVGDGSALTGGRIVTYGLLWALAQTAVGSYGLPLAGLTYGELLRVVFEVFVSWALMGISGAYVAKLIATRFSLPTIALTLIGLACGVCAARFGAESTLGLFDGVPVFGARSIWGAYLYDFWMFILYGGLFMLGCVFSLRSEHTRVLLGQAEIARGQAEALLSEVELQTLQGHVDPSLLLRVMAEVQLRYGSDPTSADRLLEQLVNFLRRAMPAVRTGRSTLAAEVKLARAHVRLQAEIDAHRPTWQMHVERGLPEMPFPPLLLLPVLEAMAAAAAPGSAFTLTMSGAAPTLDGAAHRAITLRLDGPGLPSQWLPEGLSHRLRVGMRAVFVDAWSLHVGAAQTPASAALVLVMNEPPPPDTARDSLAHRTALEIHHG